MPPPIPMRMESGQVQFLRQNPPSTMPKVKTRALWSFEDDETMLGKPDLVDIHLQFHQASAQDIGHDELHP